MTSFRVAVARAIRMKDGTSSYPLDDLEAAGVSWSWLDELVDDLRGDQINGWDAVMVSGATLRGAALDCEHPPLLIARMGAGYDTVDVEACTERGVLVTTAPEA